MDTAGPSVTLGWAILRPRRPRACCRPRRPARSDLKAENILRGPSGRWVLCDFGSCSARHGVLQSARDIALEEEVVRKYTTPAYRAPEVGPCRRGGEGPAVLRYGRLWSTWQAGGELVGCDCGRARCPAVKPRALGGCAPPLPSAPPPLTRPPYAPPPAPAAVRPVCPRVRWAPRGHLGAGRAALPAGLWAPALRGGGQAAGGTVARP